MENDRLRVPIDEPYLEALGLALICFARLEWSAIWCCEKLQQGFVKKVARLQAGTIAKKLITFTDSHPDVAIVASLRPHALEFQRLVVRRNGLVHANPGTAINGDQRLFRFGQEWTIPMVAGLADEFAEADLQLNYHFHNVL